ncbi:MAG: hypothetical protein V1791_01870, partial [Pseudomonadota bacterium]
MRTDIFDRVRPLLKVHDVKGFVIPANTGYSAKMAYAAFGNAYQYIVVANPVESHLKGYVHHPGMSQKLRRELSSLGMHIVLHEHSCFAQKEPSPAFWEHNKAFEKSLAKANKSINALEIKDTSLASILDHAFSARCDQ